MFAQGLWCSVFCAHSIAETQLRMAFTMCSLALTPAPVPQVISVRVGLEQVHRVLDLKMWVRGSLGIMCWGTSPPHPLSPKKMRGHSVSTLGS